jgi:hypothetical protein
MFAAQEEYYQVGDTKQFFIAWIAAAQLRGS